MSDLVRSVISGVGSYVPEVVMANNNFGHHHFFDEKGEVIPLDPVLVADKLQQITGIVERRYLQPEWVNSDMAAVAAERAIAESGCDPETIDQIIFAHNYGDVLYGTDQTEAVPSLAARVKNKLGIVNPNCVAYDLLFGCPGWVQGLIHADAFIKAGVAQRCLIVGSETLSRVVDVYDRDSMIFADGAGACILEAQSVAEAGDSGILSCKAVTHAIEELDYIHMGCSYNQAHNPKVRYIKMRGRKVFEYAMRFVPDAMSQCLQLANVPIEDLKMVFLHQANEKMDEAILKSMYKQFGNGLDSPIDILPMSIHKLGNSSVATVPTLLDMVRKEAIPGYKLNKGDVILLASVGAGMHINAVCYRV